MYFISSVGQGRQFRLSKFVLIKNPTKNNKKATVNKKGSNQTAVKSDDKAKSDLVAKAFNQGDAGRCRKTLCTRWWQRQAEGSLLLY